MRSLDFDQAARTDGSLKSARWQDWDPMRDIFATGKRVPNANGESVKRLHSSQVPAAKDIAVWPSDLKVLEGDYVKELTIQHAAGRHGRVLLPLFNRRQPHGPDALTPNIYGTLGARPGTAHQVTTSAMIDLSKLTLVGQGPRPSASPPGPEVSARVPLYECGMLYRRMDRRRLRFDAVTLLEHLIAIQESLFRLLLSPFRELNVMHRRVGEASCLALFGAAATARRGRGSTSRTTTFSVATCLSHWLNEPGRLSELNACARSILGTGALYVPRYEVTTRVIISGIQVGDVIRVQKMTPLRAGSFWPVTRWPLVVIDVTRVSGQLFSGASQEKAGTNAAPGQGESFTLLDASDYKKYRALFP
jgi:hypothetical protein